ncbi:MAG: flippase [Candidatus Moranbacteria bacterium]|nr:flippase [Candidatus Moranbacteria bacterium]
MRRQSVTSSLLFLTIAEIFFNFSGYIIHSVLGRMLGPSDYGRYGLVVTLTTMIIMLIGNGIPTAMSKYISEIFETKPEFVLVIKRKAAYLQFFLIGAVTIVFFLTAPLISLLLGDPTLTPLFRISSLIIPSFAAASFYLYYYIGIHRFNLQATLKIVRSFARIIFVIGLAYYFGLKGSVSAYILAPASVFITAWLIDKTRINKEFPKKFDLSFDWKKLLDYAWPVTLFMLFYEILISLDLYFVKALLGDDRLTGIYNGSLTIARIPYYLFYALTMVMLPSISRTTSQNKHEETSKIIIQTFRMMIMILLPLVILMAVYAKPLVQLFYGNRYLDAVLPLQILAAGIGFLTIFYVMSFALNGAGKIKIPMWISFAGMVLNGILNYILVLKYGISGSAAATTITSIFITAIIIYYVLKHFNKLMELGHFLKFLLAASVMLAASLLFPPLKWIFILWGIILSGIYVLFLYIIGEFTKEDILTFKKILLPRKK